MSEVALLEIGLVVTLAFHLMAMNVAAAGPFVCLWLQWRETGRGDTLAGKLSVYLARQSLVWFAVGVVLGCIALYLVWLLYPRSYFEAAAQIPARRYWFGIAELVFFVVCLLGVIALPQREGHAGRNRRFWWQWILGWLAATNLMYHFPPLFAVISVLSARPHEWTGDVRFVAWMIEPEVLARTLHFVLASFAVTGVLVMGYALKMPEETEPRERRRVSSLGGWLALAPSLCQLLVGMYVLLQLPDESRDRLLGGDMLGTGLFGGSILATIVLLHRLAAVALGDFDRKEIVRSMMWMTLVVLSMVAARQRARLSTYQRIEQEAAKARGGVAAPFTEPTANRILTPHENRNAPPQENDAAMSLQTITLNDEKAGTTAKVLVGYGFNCYSFQAAPAGKPVEVLWAAPNFESGKERPSHSGIPLLFPFPGRVRGTSFKFRGQEYKLVGLPDDGRGNAIHGFVLNRPWRVTEQTKTRVVGEFQASKDDPALLKMWPADFVVSCSYELSGNSLKSAIKVTNPDERPLPFGLGTHAYFRVPLGPGGVAADCKVTVPVTDYWPLENMLPTGKKSPADGTRGLKNGLLFSDTKLDDVFAGLKFNQGRAEATIDDSQAGRKLTITFDEGFPNCVVYNPPHREAICLEPYSCVPDPFTLEEHGVATGLRVLNPGESHTYHVDIRVE